jgi:putative hydrolase of HD superfamily
MKSFDLKDGLYLFLLSVMMLDRVRRWKGKFSMIPDNDGVHLFRASALAVYFATIEKDVHHLDLNLLDVVSSTLLHDVVEKRTGDVLGPVKHASPEIKKAFEEYEKKISLEMVDLLPDFLRIFFIENMVNAKDETSKGEMVDMVDKLDAMLKSNMERGMNPFYYELDFQEQLEKIKTKFKRPSLKFFFDEIFPSMDYDRK